MSEQVVQRVREGHQRRIIARPDYRRVGDVEQETADLYAYCTGCAWYQQGDLAEIAVEWIRHTGEAGNDE